MARRPKLIGIYKITCSKSKKIYVGSSKDIAIRINSHLIALLSGTHHNKDLQTDSNRYGILTLSFSILALTKDLKELKELEQQEINKIPESKRYNKISAVRKKPPSSKK